MNDQIMLIIIEQKLAHYDAIINGFMLWWVSSVVFCGSIIAVMWQHRDEIKDIKNVFRLVFIFFVSIIVFGCYGVYSIYRVQREISMLFLQYNIHDVPLYEFTAARNSVIIGTTSYFLIIFFFYLIWQHNDKKAFDS